MSTVNRRLEMNENQITLDRMRYSKNSSSARLVLLAILFDVIFFVSIYKSDADTFYYTSMIGVSVIYNLIFMLTAFLAEESVKNRKSSFDIVLLVIGLLQIGRIFILPWQAHHYSYQVGGQNMLAMGDGQFILCVVCLVASAVCCIAAGLTSRIQNQKLSAYLASLDMKGGL